MKYVVVTGGVVSGLGKGISISSLGVLLRACGLRVTSIKIDPYLVSFARAPARHRVLQCSPCLPRAEGLNARAPPPSWRAVADSQTGVLATRSVFMALQGATAPPNRGQARQLQRSSR